MRFQISIRCVVYTAILIPALAASTQCCSQEQDANAKTADAGTQGVGPEVVVAEIGDAGPKPVSEARSGGNCFKMTHVVCEETVLPKAYARRQLLRYGLEVRNETAMARKGVKLFLYAPHKRTATQACLGIQISNPARLHSDALGNQVLEVDLSTLAPYASALVTIQAGLLLADDAQPLPVESNADSEAFLNPEPCIESQEQGIQSLARVFQGKDASSVAGAAYKWIRTKIEPLKYTAKEYGALHALKQRKGDCSEQAFLFCALMRAREYPARYLSGYRLQADGPLITKSFHNWAEFHDGKVWRVADPQAGVLDENPSQYVAFAIHAAAMDATMAGFHRYRVESQGDKGEGSLKVRMLDK